MRRRVTVVAIVVALGLVVVLGATVAYSFLVSPPPKTYHFAAPAGGDEPFSFDHYAAALKAHVNDQGMVNYKGLKANPKDLDAFAGEAGSLDPKVYAAWSDAQKIAFWINAYNAFTLEAIVTHYPIESSLGRSLVFPKSSIRQIPGVWDKLVFVAMGQEMTLNHIEHEVLRKDFNEPRIHVALVCAAMGCPPLRNEPYTGSKLHEQLDDQARRFLANPLKFRIDRKGGIVYLSSIFEWYGDDFIKTYGTDKGFQGHSAAQRAVLSFASRYLDEADRSYLATGTYSIKYLSYDWSPNEQK